MNAVPARRLLFIALAFACAACSPSYAYVPARNGSASIDGRSAAYYPVPPKQPRGDVRIASFGFADLAAHGEPEDEQHFLHALHLRIVVANDSDHGWTLDTREQRLEVLGRGKSAPAFASADQGTPPPTIAIAPGGKRVVDLFFPLPVDEHGASTIPEFDAIWTVHTDTEAVTERAPFDRVVVEPTATVYDYGPNYFWAPPYWYDPSYGNVAFVGAAPLAAVYVGAPIGVRLHGGRHWR